MHTERLKNNSDAIYCNFGEGKVTPKTNCFLQVILKFQCTKRVMLFEGKGSGTSSGREVKTFSLDFRIRRRRIGKGQEGGSVSLKMFLLN